MDALTASPLCPAPLKLQLAEIRFAAPELIVPAPARRRVVACPKCGHASTRVHSRHRRTLADLPWHGLRVRLAVHVRRFFCGVPGCRWRIFTERLPGTATPYARRTARAASALKAIGQVEGQVSRLKLMKRTMYGKAGFQLLRRRVLAARYRGSDASELHLH